MRQIRVFAHISLDGVISPSARGEDSDFAHGGWTAPYRTPAGAALVAESYGTTFDLLLGRRTYDPLGRLLAEGAEQPDRRRPERRDEIRRDPQAGGPRMGPGRRPRPGRHGR